MEFPVQTILPYIYFGNSLCYTKSSLLSSPCVFHKANMLLLYYLMSSVLNSSTLFSASHGNVIYNYDMCNYHV